MVLLIKGAVDVDVVASIQCTHDCLCSDATSLPLLAHPMLIVLGITHIFGNPKPAYPQLLSSFWLRHYIDTISRTGVNIPFKYGPFLVLENFLDLSKFL